MSGKWVIGGFFLFTLIFTATLYYVQNYAYYRRIEGANFTMRLVTAGDGARREVPTNSYDILVGEASPLKFRACFNLEMTLASLNETYLIYEDPTPLKSPAWFECFDYARLTQDLADGTAVAFLSEKNISDGVDRIVAVYDDGRAFAWNQFNEKYAE